MKMLAMESRLEKAHQIQFQDNNIASSMSDEIKGQDLKLKRESARNNQAFKEVADHVNDLSRSNRNGEAIKHKLDQTSRGNSEVKKGKIHM